MQKKKLKELADQMHELLKENDFFGLVMIQDQDSGECRIEIAPSWGCMTIEDEVGGAQRVRVTAAAATGPPEEKQRLLKSMGCLMAMTDMLRMAQERTEKIITEITTRTGIQMEHRTTEHPNTFEGDEGDKNATE